MTLTGCTARVYLGVTLLCVLPLGGHAQGVDPAPWRDAFDACVAPRSGAELLECVGSAADPCQSAPDGETTIGMTACLSMEAQLWDGLLNEVWPGILAGAREQDRMQAAMAEPAFAGYAEALLQAQRAWIAYRDAECALDYAVWGSGSMRNPAAAGCRLNLTAERVARLTALGAS